MPRSSSQNTAQNVVLVQRAWASHPTMGLACLLVYNLKSGVSAATRFVMIMYCIYTFSVRFHPGSNTESEAGVKGRIS